jgi:pyruvate,water dikinase
LPQVGAKNASIGEISRAGIPVPPGFAVTTRACTEFLAHAAKTEDIERALSEVHIEDVGSLELASKTIRQLIESAPLPDQIERPIRSSYRILAQEHGPADLPVAVRSSSTAEDLPDASFAGQHDTFLCVRGPEQVISKFKACVSSLYTPRAICYRAKMGLGDEKALISVGVQKMVDATVAGVMFTLNPANGDRSKIVVEANWGLASSVVAGTVTPDSYLVDKVALGIVKRVVSGKTVEQIVDPKAGEVVSRNIPPERRTVPCLSDDEVLRLARLGRLIETHYGRPQNIEWAIDRDVPSARNILVLQSRLETVWSPKNREPLFGRKANLFEHMVERLKEGRRLS